MSTMKPTRKYQREMLENLEKMKREREQFYAEEREFEQRKKKYATKTDSELPNLNTSTIFNDEKKKASGNLETKSAIPEVSPGREVFYDDKRYQNFTFDELIPVIDDLDSDLASTRKLFELKMSPLTDVSPKTMKRLFYLMSLDDNCTVSESCCSYLKERVDKWIPKMSHIINVFTNWGTTYESLGMNDFDVKLVYKYSTPKKHTRVEDLPTFCNFHHEHVFAYLTSVIPKSRSLDLYTEVEVLLVMRIFIKMSLDKRFPRIIDSIKATKLISTCVEVIQNWDNSKVIYVTKCIYDESESTHNQISVVTTILSRISRCNEIRSCLAFAILRKIILKKNFFEYPNEDSDLLELVKRMKSDLSSPEDMSSMYLVLLLIHSCIHGRGMLEEECKMEIVEEIQECLEKVKISLSRQPNNYDAELLGGRISACTAVWTLFGNKDNVNYSQ